MRRSIVITAVAVMLGGGCATAVGATPIRMTTNGEEPWVFVDRQGVTHVTWNVEESLQTRTFYRRAAAGSTVFSPTVELPVAAGVDFTGSYITQDPAPSNRLVLITERASNVTGTPGMYGLTSTDNGVTWTPAVAVAEPSPSVNIGGGRVNVVANGPLGIWVVNGNPTLRLVKLPAALTPAVTAAEQVSISPSAYNGQVQFDAAGQPVFAFSDLDKGYVRVGETGPDQTVFSTEVVSSMHLASGPRGSAVLWYGGPSTDDGIRLRRIVGGVLTPEQRLSSRADSSTGVPYLSADQTGRFHAVWRSSADVVYRRSETGASWTPATTLVRVAGVNRPYSLVVSAGPDGNGWVVYTTGITKSPVFVVRLPSDDPSVPDTQGIENPQVSRRGSGIFITPRTPSLADLRKRKCVRVRVQSTKPAAIRVAIFSGRRSIRVFGTTTVRFSKAGKKLVCVKVPLRARTFDVRQPFRFAFAVREGSPNPRGPAPGKLTTTGFTFFK